ncbi:hypothetical protein AAKU52_002607 [Pedobacter sp. CG_S7]|uniref:hypothetical protein n=1 Tax=Pedobacter sp. CG_S7 TaxID=3143930 RepID=UPI003399B3EB
MDTEKARQETKIIMNFDDYKQITFTFLRIFLPVAVLVILIGMVHHQYLNVVDTYQGKPISKQTEIAKVVDKLYRPSQFGSAEKFILVLSTRNGKNYSINDRRLFGKAEKGDSVSVTYDGYQNIPHYLDVKKLTK